MAFEKRYARIAARPFISDGKANGELEIADTASFKVKQKVVITATGEPNLELEIKAVLSDQLIKVGPMSSNIFQVKDISAYTLAKNSAILADEQPRSGITGDEIRRAVYDEEPTMANRSVIVDKYGRYWDSVNPLPVTQITEESQNKNWDKIIIARNCDKDIEKVTFLKNSEEIRVYDLFYDSDKDLIEVDKDE
jgi:hypothetical protein